MNKKKDLLIPRELAIETIFGCNLKCSMCSIDLPTSRKKMVMPIELFHIIVDSLTPYVKNIERVDLFGLGEPLLDPHIFKRIKYLKDKGFRNLGISTNANLLDAKRRRLLLESKIETIIFSIDGINKKTHEQIRSGANFDLVVKNVQEMIKLRDEEDFPTRFILRFIRQPTNQDEWEPYKVFWNSRLSKNKNDYVAMYDMHNNAGTVSSKSDIVGSGRINDAIEAKPCHFIFECLIILADGTIALCHPDFHEQHFSLGQIPEMSPIEAFNSGTFRQLRKKHADGKKTKISLCRECSIPYSEVTRKTGWGAG
ncbi:MAG: radical SAM/SPASM domain-containing protein [Promethearchaeota archaeon]